MAGDFFDHHLADIQRVTDGMALGVKKSKRWRIFTVADMNHAAGVDLLQCAGEWFDDGKDLLLRL